MKSKKNLLEQLNSLPHFSKTAVLQLASQAGFAESTVDTYISRFLKHGEIIRLKNGVYVSDNFLKNNKNDISYSFYLANILRTPSYISSWSALQYYNLATEAVHTFTSVTPKVTRTYKTDAGTFAFQSLRKELFSDFSLVSGTFDFFIASPAKALFDLLYFKTGQFRSVTVGEIEKIVDEVRIDLDDMERVEKERFFSLMKKHCHE